MFIRLIKCASISASEKSIKFQLPLRIEGTFFTFEKVLTTYFKFAPNVSTICPMAMAQREITSGDGFWTEIVEMSRLE